MHLKPLAIALSATLVSGIATLPAALAQSSEIGSAELRALPGAYLVELKTSKNSFRNDATKAGVKYKERYSYDTLWNGVSIEASKSDIEVIKSLSGVARVWPVAIVEAPERPTEASPELFTAIAMTGADIAQNELGYTGKGVKVAVMDTGIDIDHPAFGGSGTNGSTPFPTARVAFGYDFVGDAFNADPSSNAFNPNPTPDPVPDDCGGHGSHVAGIVGANGDVKGVAPEATLGAYRVFGCAGSTTADIMIAAMERALKDGAQVLNMSIGSAYQWPQYPTAVAASRLVERGVVVVTSIGNSGANGLYSASAPGLGDKVIGTASFDNTFVYQDAFAASTDTTLSADDGKFGYTPASAAPLPPASGAFPMTRTGTTSSAADACAALPAGSLTGKVALIRRGTCGFYNKAINAQTAGAVGVVLYNNTAGFLTPTVAGPLPVTIPVVMITQADGAAVDARIQAGPTYQIWGAGKTSTPSPSGNLISSFSSYGLSPDLALKPDIGAPGGSIYSTVPLEQGAYGLNSGTSMASPHVAGAAALVLQAKPRTRAEDVRTILQNSADPKAWSLSPTSGLLDHVHRQGAGMVDIDDSILATTRIVPSKISAGEGEAGPYTQRLTLINTGSESVTYTVTSVNATSTGGVITPSFFLSDASVAFSAGSVTVPAGGSATVDATITPATSPVNGQYGGYIVFTPTGPGQTYRVPFAGFVGDYQGITVLNGTKVLAKITSCTKFLGFDCVGTAAYAVAPAGTTFTLGTVGGMPDIPYFALHFDHQVQKMEAVIRNAATGQPIHSVFNKAIDEEYLPRNSATSTYFAFYWDGTRIHSNGYNGVGYDKNLTKLVPDGDYVIEFRVLKANGSASNPAHWETWTSPAFKIDRP